MLHGRQPANARARSRSVAMITDMHRLERAARLSMGDFEAAPLAVAPPSRQPFFPPKAIAALAALAVLAIGVLVLG
jgi:hypothetical protein